MDNRNKPVKVFTARKVESEEPKLTRIRVFTDNEDNDSNSQKDKRVIENSDTKVSKSLVSNVQHPPPVLPQQQSSLPNKPPTTSTPPQPKINNSQPQKPNEQEQKKPQLSHIPTNQAVKVPTPATKNQAKNNNANNDVGGIIGVLMVAFLIILIIGIIYASS